MPRSVNSSFSAVPPLPGRGGDHRQMDICNAGEEEEEYVANSQDEDDGDGMDTVGAGEGGGGDESQQPHEPRKKRKHNPDTSYMSDGW